LFLVTEQEYFKRILVEGSCFLSERTHEKHSLKDDPFQLRFYLERKFMLNQHGLEKFVKGFEDFVEDDERFVQALQPSERHNQ